MTMATKHEILREKLREYLASGKADKGELLDHIQAVTKMARKAVIRRLNALARTDSKKQAAKRGRNEQYGPRVTLALKDLWELFNEICAERLQPNFAEYISVLQS